MGIKLVGRPAYDETDRNVLINRVTQHEAPDIASLNRGLPRDLCTIVRKAIARDPDDRYGTAEGMAEDLRRFIDDRPILARRIGAAERCRRWCRRNPAVASLAAALAVVLLSAFVAVTGLWWTADAARNNEAKLRRTADDDRLAAEGAREDAVAAQKRSVADTLRANDLANVNHQQLVQVHVANGARGWQTGDPWNAMLWFAEALRLDRVHPGRESSHRVRLKNLADQSPRITKFWYVPDGVAAAEFSPDGRFVVAAGFLRWGPFSDKPNAAHIWDAVTGEPACPPLAHDAAVRHATFSPDGLSVITASDDGTARLWDARTGAPLGLPFRHEAGSICYAAFSADGRRIVTAGRDGNARVWDISTGEESFAQLAHPNEVVHAEFSPDGRYLATATHLGQVAVWNAKTGAPAFPPLVMAGIRAWFSPDSRRLMTGFNGPEAVVWELTSKGI